MWIDETDRSANRGSLVQADAHGADVAVARPVPVPPVRAETSSVLGRTVAGCCRRAGIAGQDGLPKRLSNSN